MAVHLLVHQPDQARHRIQLGSVRVTHDKPGYDPGAVVPRGDWKPLTAPDLERLRPTATTPTSALTELVRLPLPTLDTDDLAGRRDAAATLNPLREQQPTPLLATTTSQPGCITTTGDHTTGRRIGLHVDNHDRLTHPHRHQSRRRLGLNLGPGPRYLLLADLTIQDICETLHTDHDGHYPHTDDVRRYVAQGHPLRVIRIRLEPGDAYLAPTELQPHDGSTTDIPLPSVIAFWLGHWPTAPHQRQIGGAGMQG